MSTLPDFTVPTVFVRISCRKEKKGLLAEEKENSKETEECKTRMFQVEPRGNLFCL